MSSASSGAASTPHTTYFIAPLSPSGASSGYARRNFPNRASSSACVRAACASTVLTWRHA